MSRSFVGWLWLLSGLPVGLALVALPPIARFWCFSLFVLLDLGHSLSPIVLAWTHREFREKVIYPQPYKFLLLPGLIAGLAITIGVVTQAGWTSYRPGPYAYSQITGWDNPLPLLVWTYSAWNLYHFAMQDFGILMLCAGPAFRQLKRMGCLFGLLGIYFATTGLNLFGVWQMPGLIQAWWISFMLIGTVSFNHWIVDIGLSSRIAKHGWVFIMSVLLAGLVGFLWMVPTSHGMMIRMVPILICTRFGLGFVHFLYSRWVWQFSDPRVRATIGREFPWLGLAARPS